MDSWGPISIYLIYCMGIFGITILGPMLSIGWASLFSSYGYLVSYLWIWGCYFSGHLHTFNSWEGSSSSPTISSSQIPKDLFFGAPLPFSFACFSLSFGWVCFLGFTLDRVVSLSLKYFFFRCISFIVVRLVLLLLSSFFISRTSFYFLERLFN